MAKVTTKCQEKRKYFFKSNMLLLRAVHQVRFVPHKQTTCLTY